MNEDLETKKKKLNKNTGIRNQCNRNMRDFVAARWEVVSVERENKTINK